MARDATDAPPNVGTMIEINVVGQIMHPHPRDRFAGLHALAKRSVRLSIGGDRLMAIHADRRRGDSGKGGALHRRVAIATVQPQLAGMDLVGIGTG